MNMAKQIFYNCSRYEILEGQTEIDVLRRYNEN